MIFGKHINRYYLKHLPALLLGVLALVMIDVFQLKIPELYRLVVNGINDGYVVIDSELMDCYKGLTNKNNDVTLTEFPKFAPGANNITFDGDITSLEILGRWRTL